MVSALCIRTRCIESFPTVAAEPGGVLVFLTTSWAIHIVNPQTVMCANLDSLVHLTAEIRKILLPHLYVSDNPS